MFSTIYILWLRQIKRYLRSRARIVGSLGQPLLFLVALLLWERLTGFGSVVLMFLAMPFGLRKIWQHFRGHPIAMMLTGSLVWKWELTTIYPNPLIHGNC